MIAASSNGLNLTDGLDGLAVGSAAQVFGAFTVVAFWQFRHQIFYDIGATGSDPFDLAIVAAALAGASAGFLWWNTAPAKIFMGDTGSLMLGGAMAVLAILLNTQLLLLVLGGLYVVETLSVIVQVGVFKRTGTAVVPHGADTSSFRAGRLAGVHGDRSVLGPERPVGCLRTRASSTRTSSRKGLFR